MSFANYTPLNSLQGKNSYLYLLPFTQPAQANDRVFLPMDSAIDDARIVGIETHAHLGGFDFDLPAQIKISDVVYNVITPNELNAMTLTIVDKNRRQCLDRCPFSVLFNRFAPAFNGQNKTFRKFDLSILTGESYVSFNINTLIASPFVAPITFYFE